MSEGEYGKEIADIESKASNGTLTSNDTHYKVLQIAASKGHRGAKAALERVAGKMK